MPQRRSDGGDVENVRNPGPSVLPAANLVYSLPATLPLAPDASARPDAGCGDPTARVARLATLPAFAPVQG
jgi:hypothetical protein